MSHWAEYVKERFGWDAIVTDDATVIYSIQPPFALIHDMYVAPQMRKIGIASDLADQVAAIGKEKGCTHLWSQVASETLNSNEALMANLGYGFRMTKTDATGIIMMKEIGE